MQPIIMIPIKEIKWIIYGDLMEVMNVNKISEQESNIVKQTENMPFWKIGFFETMCVERIWKVYERACVGKVWDKHIEFLKIIEIAWEGVMKDLKIDEEYLFFCDNNIIDDISDDLDIANNIIVSAIGTLLDEINQKSSSRICHVVSRNFEFLDHFLYNYYGLEINNKNDEFIHNHELIINEIRQQNIILNKLNEINSKETFYPWGRNNCNESILGNFWFLE